MLATTAGPCRVMAYAPGIFRLTMGAPAGPDYGILAQAAAPPPVTASAGDGGAHIEAGEAGVAVSCRPMTISLTRGGRPLLASTCDGHFARPFRLPPFARSGDGWVVALGLDSQEAVYGLGEKWGPLDKRGQLITSHVTDSLGVNAEISYKNCPFAWSPEGWGVFVHTPCTVRHGVGHPPWSHRAYVLEIDDPHLDLFLIAAATPAEVLERYTWLTGRSPRPPLWSLGVWLSRAYYKDAGELLAAARTVRDRNMPCDVIVLDGRSWLDTETRFAFEWDPARYPEPRRVTKELHDLGFKVCCWEYPLVSVHHPLFRDLADKGWLIEDGETGQPYVHHWDAEPFGSVLTPLPPSGLIDLTHPEAYAFWRDQHHALFETGVDVIKSDFGEQVPEHARAANGDDGRRLHNVYPLLYNRCVFEATDAHTAGHGMVWGRAGWAGSQRTPIQWGGDPQSDWEGLAASIRGGLSWGLSGAPCYATDIGGFYGEQPDAELFVRWTQTAVFSSHMRFHGIGPREPWAFGAEAETIVRDLLELRYRLIPYIEGVLAEAAATGLPAMRAMPLAVPDDPLARAYDIQYLFGPDLLVVPIVRPGGEVRYYLPDGLWFDLRTGETVTGGRAVRETWPLDRLPVFVRDGAVLPLGPSVQSTAEIGDRARLERLVVHGQARSAPCLADGGITLARAADGTPHLDGVPPEVEIELRGDAP